MMTLTSGGGVGLAFQHLDDATRNALNEVMAAPDPAFGGAMPAPGAAAGGWPDPAPATRLPPAADGQADKQQQNRQQNNHILTRQ